MIFTNSYSISVMKTSISEQISPASSALSRWVLLAVFGLGVLFGVSCSVRRSQTSQSHRLDSISERIEVLPTPVTLPETKATLSLPLSHLLDLPEGAGFHARRGKTHLTLTRRGDSLEATATTDSLTVLPLLTQREQQHTAHSAKISEVATSATTGFPFAPWQLATALTLIIIIILTLLLWPRRRM